MLLFTEQLAHPWKKALCKVTWLMLFSYLARLSIYFSCGELVTGFAQYFDTYRPYLHDDSGIASITTYCVYHSRKKILREGAISTIPCSTSHCTAAVCDAKTNLITHTKAMSTFLSPSCPSFHTEILNSFRFHQSAKQACTCLFGCVRESVVVDGCMYCRHIAAR